MADLAAADAATGSAACDNCGAAMQGRFCHDCGARPFTADDYALRRFARGAFHEITDLEHSKLYRTLHALLLKPGFLTQEYFSARRVRYIKPLGLLLAIFALHIFVYSMSSKVAFFDIDYMLAASYNPDTLEGMNRILRNAAERRDIPLEELKANITDRWIRNFSLSQIPQVLVFAVLLKLIFLFSRRRFVEHLIFAMHFYAFQVLTMVLMWPAYYVLGLKLSGLNLTIALFKLVIDVTYIYFATRRFYGGRSLKEVGRAVAIFLAYVAVYSVSFTTAMMAALFYEAPIVKKDHSYNPSTNPPRPDGSRAAPLKQEKR